MKRGIGLMGESQPGAVTEAIACFDRALALRRQLPVDHVPLFGYGLAACLLNRADALMLLRDANQVVAALHAYDEAIVVLRTLPLDDDLRYRRRLAIAHQNLGLTLQTQRGTSSEDAIDAFTNALTILDHEQAIRIDDRQYLQAAVWMNLANARAAATTVGAETQARDAALHAISLVSVLEVDDADAAEVGLKARHVLCQTIANRLSRPAVDDDAVQADVHAATDAVDDGLGLVRQWEHKGVSRFRRIAYDLFRFGARVYGHYQPQFLQEFIRDNIDPARSSPAYVNSAEIQSAVQEALSFTSR
jgi:hypothetical protein